MSKILAKLLSVFARPADQHTDAVKVQLDLKRINGGLYLSNPQCTRKSRLPENFGEPYYCAAGIGKDVVVKDKHLQEFKLFEGGVLAICEFSGMDVPDEKGNKHVHWGPCESTCSYPGNVRQ